MHSILSDVDGRVVFGPRITAGRSAICKLSCSRPVGPLRADGSAEAPNFQLVLSTPCDNVELRTAHMSARPAKTLGHQCGVPSVYLASGITSGKTVTVLEVYAHMPRVRSAALTLTGQVIGSLNEQKVRVSRSPDRDGESLDAAGSGATPRWTSELGG